MALIIENLSGAQLDLNDLGFSMVTGGTADLTTESDPTTVARSAASGGDLNTIVTAGNLVVKDPIDDTTNLSIADSLAVLRSHNEAGWRQRADQILVEGGIDFEETGAGTNTIGFVPPAAITSDITWELPSIDAPFSGYALTSNAAGVLAWAPITSPGWTDIQGDTGTATAISAGETLNIQGSATAGITTVATAGSPDNLIVTLDISRMTAGGTLALTDVFAVDQGASPNVKFTMQDMITDLSIVTGTAGDPDQNLWETITADAGGSAVANTITDTLTLAGGTGITTTRSGDTITFDSDRGDVFGPAGATDEAIARYDTATGKLIQNSATNLDDSGNVDFDGTITGGDLRIRHDTLSTSDLIFDANGRNGATGASISRDGASGFLWLFPNATTVQWIAGDPASGVGVNQFYIDSDMQGDMNIQTLPGAGRNGLVTITYGGIVQPGQDETSDLGTTALRWGSLFLSDDLNISNSGGDEVKIQAQAAAFTGYTLTLPNSDGTPNQVLTTNGAGVLTWTTPTTGAPNAFATIAVPAGGSVVADNNADTLTLTQPGSGLTITGTPGTDTIAFALSNDLAALEALGTSGFSARTAADTWAIRTLTQPAAGLTITNPAGTAGNPTFALANDLLALENLGSTGIAVRTAANTWAQRTLTASALEDQLGIQITDGGGVAANPTIGFNIDGITSAPAGAAGNLAATDEIPVHDKSQGTGGANRTMTGQQIADGVSTIIGGFGDVSSSANITDHSIVRGDGGVKGVQDSTTGAIDWTIGDDGQILGMVNVTNGGTGGSNFAFDFQNQQATNGDGLRVFAGEALGDVTFRLDDSDGSFGGTGGVIMEVEADQGYITFFKTYAQTIIDRGIVYGIDQQNPDTPGADFNTQFGQYRMAGTPISLRRYEFFADQVDYPRGTNWSINVGAPASPDTVNAALKVRRFDDTTVEAIGFMVAVPLQARTMIVRTRARAQSTPGGAVAAVMQIRKRSIPDNAAVSAWSTNALTNIDLPTNTNFQYDTTTNTLTNWGLTAGVTYQMQLVRNASAGGDTLTGDLSLLSVQIEFR